MLRKFVFLTGLLCAPQFAFAHAHLKKAEPKQESIVNKAPQRLLLSFSEPLETTMSKITIKDSAGHAVESGPIVANTDDPRTVEVALRDLKDTKETYQVSWKAVAKDTHKMTGSYKFSVDPSAK